MKFYKFLITTSFVVLMNNGLFSMLSDETAEQLRARIGSLGDHETEGLAFRMANQIVALRDAAEGRSGVMPLQEELGDGAIRKALGQQQAFHSFTKAQVALDKQLEIFLHNAGMITGSFPVGKAVSGGLGAVQNKRKTATNFMADIISWSKSAPQRVSVVLRDAASDDIGDVMEMQDSVTSGLSDDFCEFLRVYAGAAQTACMGDPWKVKFLADSVDFGPRFGQKTLRDVATALSAQSLWRQKLPLASAQVGDEA